MGTSLPTNIDATYPDGTDPSKKAHQQHHDQIHNFTNTHDSVSTNVHGIADTSQLVVKTAGMPVTRARGAWTASTAYLAGDVVTQGGSVWRALTDHTSGTTFSGTTNWEQWGYTKTAADAAYAPVSGSANYAPSSGSTVYAARGDAQFAAVETDEFTTSTSPTDLATVGPAVTVTVPASGRVKVELSVVTYNTVANAYVYAGVALSGANTVGALTPNSRSIIAMSATANQRMMGSRSFIISGLTPGSTTFTMKYAVDVGTAGNGHFSGRALLVTPL